MELEVTHRRRTVLRGVLAVIARDGKILLQKRSEHLADPGTWVLPGGELLEGEGPRETLVRACAEELGIIVRPTVELGILEIGEERIPVWRVLWKGQELSLSERTVAGAGWFTLEEMLTLSPMRYEEELRTFLRSRETLLEGGEARLRPAFAQASTFAKATVDKSADRSVGWQSSGGQAPPPVETTIPEKAELAALVVKAQDGDHDAFALLYDYFITPVYRYVAFRVPQAIAEDLVADIFVKAWEKLGSYHARRGIPFSSWLFRIARNVVIDTYRTHRETEEMDELQRDEDRWNNPRLKITQELQATTLRRALTKLPRRYREVLLLSFMSDLGNEEIARTLRMRVGSVRILKHRALKRLSALLPASMREELP